MSKKVYEVTLPIAGHAFVKVEADSEEDAIDRAFAIVQLSDVEEWEALDQFTSGNVCYCPRPWEPEATCLDDDE